MSKAQAKCAHQRFNRHKAASTRAPSISIARKARLRSLGPAPVSFSCATRPSISRATRTPIAVLTLQHQSGGEGVLRMRLHAADGSSRALELALADAKPSPSGQTILEFALKAFAMSGKALTQIVAVSLEAALPLDLVLVKLSITARCRLRDFAGLC